jgi:pilus assembly protein FimV
VALNKEKVMDAARKFVDRGQFDKAVKEYLRIVREDPRDVRVWLKIGDLYAKKGAKQEAVETYLRVAQFYHEQGFFLKAVAVYKQILKLDPRLVDVNLKLAELYGQLGLISDAMQHFEAVAAHFHREGNTREALATVKRLVELDPENIATRIKLAELYSKDGMVAEAAATFSAACDQLRRQGRQEDFIKVAERLLFHQPANHALTRELAALYLHRNDPRRALQKLQVSFKADPRDVETLSLLASAFQALEQKSKTVSVLKEMARIHQENKETDKAAAVFHRVLELAANDADAVAFLGEQAARSPAPPPAERAPLQFTNELPATRQPTGSMPLVPEDEISAVDFALPEYDDGDFSQALERSAHDIRANSAEGEAHAEEIAKTLAEADVYVKYNLHQKAIDHLRRIFSFDPHNVEARERLKEILVSQGRTNEAAAELFVLAELVAAESPDRAEGYLRELLAINGDHTGAFELARRFRLRVSRLASEPSTTGGMGYDDFEYGEGAVARDAGDSIDSIDNFDPHELIGAAHGSPTPGRPPRPTPQDDAFRESPSQTTRQLSAEQASALLGRAQEALEHEFMLDDDALSWQHDDAGRGGPYASEFAHDAKLNMSLDASVDAQLDDAQLGNEIDLEVATELGGFGDDRLMLPEDMPFDPHEAREFDAAVGRGFDPYAEDQETPVESYDVADAISVDTAAVDLMGGNEARGERELEDELEEAEFYASQHMVRQAQEILRSLAARYPHHPLILAKLRDLTAPPPTSTGYSADHDALTGVEELGGATEAIEIDDLEEVGDFEELEPEPEEPGEGELRTSDSGGARPKRAPSVMLENPVDDADADTHYDLGIAYKDMGLYHEAIKAFDKARRGSKEVQSRLMIGICHREMGNGTEAVNQFKQGLHSHAISDRERQSLFYEIGATYEGMNDTSEALYYFEMVVKRDPSFADAASRAEMMRSALRRSG